MKLFGCLSRSSLGFKLPDTKLICYSFLYRAATGSFVVTVSWIHSQSLSCRKSYFVFNNNPNPIFFLIISNNDNKNYWVRANGFSEWNISILSEHVLRSFDLVSQSDHCLASYTHWTRCWDNVEICHSENLFALSQ